MPGARQLSCKVVQETGTKCIVGLSDRLVNSSEMDCGTYLELGERCYKVWWESVVLHMG